MQQIAETAGGIDGRRADSSHVDSRLAAHRVQRGHFLHLETGCFFEGGILCNSTTIRGLLNSKRILGCLSIIFLDKGQSSHCSRKLICRSLFLSVLFLRLVDNQLFVVRIHDLCAFEHDGQQIRRGRRETGVQDCGKKLHTFVEQTLQQGLFVPLQRTAAVAQFQQDGRMEFGNVGGERRDERLQGVEADRGEKDLK
ncbi:hypothetical protein WR25_14457 [Diploscapter pachys]|uniref:Uncharacterized protein n=1 Tax=Diploscapter pachys TaxID=2018661 RepID=A0A2A2LD75_9BILA|nr:hypothetical protein WR25_14457 [Diploscapter pachys]